MQYYDHAMLGATLALAGGVHRRQGWGIVIMAAAAAALPDWDDLVPLVGPPGYATVHRVWGHNLLVTPLLSGLVGVVGYLCWASLPRRTGTDRPRGIASLAVWVVVGVLVSLSHLLGDVCYCGVEKGLDWPVALLWPFSLNGCGYPMVTWADRGVTCVLGVTLVAACLRRSFEPAVAVLGLAITVGYIVFCGVTL